MALPGHIPIISIISDGGQHFLMVCGRRTSAVIRLEEATLDMDGDMVDGIIPLRPPHAVSVHVDIGAVSIIK